MIISFFFSGAIVWLHLFCVDSFIFPSPRERVKYYMGSWYPGLNYSGLSYFSTIESAFICSKLNVASKHSVQCDRDVLYTMELLDARMTKEMAPTWTSCYLKDAANVLRHVESKLDRGTEIKKSVIMRCGDSSLSSNFLPTVSKTRKLFSEFSTIVWPLRINKHFNDPLKKLNDARDTHWNNKMDKLLWRGACTGGGQNTRVKFVERYALQKNKDIDIGMSSSCRPFGRRLDAKHMKSTKTIEEMLKYKYLLSLEGNDVATGLKWQLASSSVVFMPTPTVESYAMEGLLVPFLHYIPVNSDGSNLETMLEWAKNNDWKVKWISDQATKYIKNLWTSDKAQEDNMLIRNMLANVYYKQFGRVLETCFEN